ncbi:MAG TPA: hypothetical protein DD666_12495 [Advenella kashmirensis]|uniref:Uncharacterized protein n=1 Tax=Advenella kashmirensis TaxID=310575 RepID=A0A356LH42_9BURK|nr:hypothetical protein [Advenella kashmirensis]
MGYRLANLRNALDPSLTEKAQPKWPLPAWLATQAAVSAVPISSALWLNHPPARGLVNSPGRLLLGKDAVKITWLCRFWRHPPAREDKNLLF